MARGSARSPAANAVSIVAVCVFALLVIALAVFAFQRANPELAQATAAPVPSFSLGVQTPTPTSAPTPKLTTTPARDAERFLAVGSSAMWRATAGACGGAAPLVERSRDGGATWTDVTAHYLGLAQVASLDAFSALDAEMVSGVGAGCDTQLLRTYTNGQFWESYPDVLAVSRYVDLADPAIVHLETGPVAAPCPVAHGLRAWRDTVALICDDIGYVWRNGAWAALPAYAEAAAVAISGTDVFLATVGIGCPGFAFTRYAGGDPGAGAPAGCAEVADAWAPVAMVAYGGGILLWSGDRLVSGP